jgi:cytochrome c-type biogenesis protein CcmH/NrfG
VPGLPTLKVCPEAAAPVAVIAWEHPTFENLIAPSTAIALLERAITATPSNAALHTRLGNVHVDQFDFGRAALAFEAALRLDPSLTSIRIRLARA